MSNFTTTIKSIPLNPGNPSSKIGIEISRSGVVTLDEYFFTDENYTANRSPEMCKFLVANVAGTLVFEYFDNNFGFIENALSGFWYPIKAIRVVTSHTFINGGLKTTTASEIGWYGGDI